MAMGSRWLSVTGDQVIMVRGREFLALAKITRSPDHLITAS
jgi:hypothetical protein